MTPRPHPEHNEWKAHSLRLAARIRELEAALQEVAEYGCSADRKRAQAALDALDEARKDRKP